MHDYKPQFKKTSRTISRKLVLFIVIASLATIFFFYTEEQATTTSSNHVVAIPAASSPTKISITLPSKKSFSEPTENIVLTTQQPIVDKASPNEAEKKTTISTKEEKAVIPTKIDTLPTMSSTWDTYTVKSGDSLANIFKNWELSASELHHIVNSSKLAKSLADIRPGEKLKLLRDDDNSLLELVVVRSPTESLLIQKTESGYEAETIHREVEVRHAYASGIINTSLFIDGQKAGLADAQIMEMAGIFGWDIDFALEIRQGDSFKLLYEQHFLDGKKFRNGPILVAQFNNHKKTYHAVRYTTPNGDTSYYDPNDGRNKKRAFIRTPVKFARISSRFSGNRYHPKLKKWRAHRGVDYAAPRGTPIKAAGNGKIIFRGKKGGYGNTVMIQHGSKQVTLYAHLSKFAKASRKGKKVSQGQIIGYVGSSGLATGPHLHYEFRVNGVHRNPLTVKLPKADPINKKFRDDFNLKSKEKIAIFNKFDMQQIALNIEENQDG